MNHSLRSNSVGLGVKDSPPLDHNEDRGLQAAGRTPTRLFDPTSNNTVNDSVELLLDSYKASMDEQRFLTGTIWLSIEQSIGQLGPEGVPIRWCYVPVLPNDRVAGRCMSLDFGCSESYFQVALCEVLGKGASGSSCDTQKHPGSALAEAFVPADTQAFVLTRSVRHADMDAFCDFVAACIGKVMKDNGLTGTPDEPLFLGITAGFDARVQPQVYPCVARVAQTLKDFKMGGFIGEDFVARFHAAFARAKLPVQIGSVVNDTVSTLLAGVFQAQHMAEDADCSIGVVANRCGANLSFLETEQEFLDACSSDGRLLLRSLRINGNCAVVNTEAGMWVGRHNELLDCANLVENFVAESKGGEFIRFESIASGVWYPEQLRHCLKVLRDTGGLNPTFPDCQMLSLSDCFEVFVQCEQWSTGKITSIVSLTDALKKLMGARYLDELEASCIAHVCQAIVGRTSQVIASAVFAVARHVYGKSFPNKMVVACSGNLFSFTQIKTDIEQWLKAVMLGGDVEIVVVDAAFGSALTAAAAGTIMPKKNKTSAYDLM